MEQSRQAANGHLTNLQLAEIADFRKCRNAIWLPVPPRRPKEIEHLNVNAMLLTTSPNKSAKDFLKLFLQNEKIDFEVGLR